jgi:carboxyl-terminal processing protease
VRKNLFFLILVFFAFSCPALIAANSSQVFNETLQLLQKYYYNPRQISKKLNPHAIENCQRKAALDSYDAINCLVLRLKDPYTKFLTPPEAKKELKRIKTITTGLGIVRDALNPTVVSNVQADSPSAKAGVKPRDRIMAINGIPIEYLSEDEINQYLNGSVLGEKITLDLQRGYLFYSASLTVQELHTVPIRSKILADNIAYIKIDDLLTASAPRELQKTLSDKKMNATNGLVLDLRGNKGGLLSSAVSISDFFLSEGTIVTTRSYQGEKEVAAKAGQVYLKPIVVLIDGKTASASEIIAGALKDNHRALLLGTRSFGKGLVQQIKTLSDGSALHITVNKFYTPSGNEINRVGIEPDIYVPDTGQQLRLAVQSLKKIPSK